jgi:hypothetical protein
MYYHQTSTVVNLHIILRIMCYVAGKKGLPLSWEAKYVQNLFHLQELR